MAVAVFLAALPGLHAPYTSGVLRVSAGQARLYGPLGVEAVQVLSAVAGLQIWPTAGVIQPYQRADAVAGALLSSSFDVTFTCCHVLIVCKFALGFVVAPQKRLPAY